MALFRSEALLARERAWLGRIVLARPLSFALLTLVAVAFVAALALFFCLTEYTRKARVSGVLAPEEGIVRIIAQQAGRIERVDVREGGQVQKGAAMVTIVDSRAGTTFAEPGAAVARRVDERRGALALQREHTLAAMQTEQAALERRRAAIARELGQLDRELDHHERRARLAAEAHARAEDLAMIGFLSYAARDRENDAALDAAARVEAMRRSRMAFERELATVEFEAAAAHSRAQAQLAGIDMQRAALEQERVERELQFGAAIAAPASGMVASVLVEPGQMVVPGTTLATLIPAGARLEAHLYSASRSIGFVRPGQHVLLRYLAYPHQKFGSHEARILAVSRNPLSPAELGLAAPEAGREPLYRIKAELSSQVVIAYGRPEPLQAGMQLEADVMLDRRRLIEWIFEPLLSLAGRA